MENSKKIVEYFKIYLEPNKQTGDFSSWQEKFLDEFGPLYGYKKDLENKSLEDVLFEILSLQFESNEKEVTTNYQIISPFYIFYLNEKLVENTEDNKKEYEGILEEIDKLKSLTRDCCRIFIKYGIIDIIELQIPYNKISKFYAGIMGENIYNPINNNSFYNKSREDIESNIDYNPTIKPGNIYTDLNLALKIYCFSKSNAKLYDITKFLSSVIINNTESGGNFELKMSLTSQENLESNKGYVVEDINKKGYERALYLQSIFRENDLIFIKFETLKIEDKSKNEHGDIHGKFWDMIGLIDTNIINSSPNQISLSISGRDLIKLFIEDNNYFIPYRFASSEKKSLNIGANDKIFHRLFSSGTYNTKFTTSNRSIENSIGFIFSQLSNVEMLTDEGSNWLLNEYGEDIGKTFVYSEEGVIKDKKGIKGIWGIINFAVDEKLSHYRITDGSLISTDGSILDSINNLCQKPFVEFITDTFKDKFSLIVRRPPWDEEGIKNSIFVTIDPYLALSDNLVMDTNINTVFQFFPQKALLGGENITYNRFPIIVLDEYAKIWGCKMYTTYTKYFDINSYNQSINSKEKNKKSPYENFIEDFIFLLETEAYKPFTRTGTITIRGDRRIKRGSWVYYKKTNEMFYVDAVSNSAIITSNSVERITVLNVSRGMIKDYIDSSNQKGLEDNDFIDEIKNSKTNRVERKKYAISYFNLLATDYLRNSLKNNIIDIKNKYSSERKIVNKDITFTTTDSIVVKGNFDFFLKGKQFKKMDKVDYKNTKDLPKAERKRLGYE